MGQGHDCSHCSGCGSEEEPIVADAAAVDGAEVEVDGAEEPAEDVEDAPTAE